MDISTQSKEQLAQILNTETKSLTNEQARVALVDLKEIAEELQRSNEFNKAALANTSGSKLNAVGAAGSDFPVLPKDADFETVKAYWFALYKWLLAHGAAGFATMRMYLGSMFPEYFMDGGGFGGMSNPRGADGYLAQPAHDGTSAYSNTMPRDKTLNFNKRTGAMELQARPRGMSEE